MWCSELALLQNLLHGLPQRHLSVATGHTFPGEELESRCVTARQSLTFDLCRSRRSAAPVHSHLEQARVPRRSPGLVVRVALPRARRPAPSRALPQVLERSAAKAAPDLEAVGEEENLPALLQFGLNLKTKKESRELHSLTTQVMCGSPTCRRTSALAKQ